MSIYRKVLFDKNSKSAKSPIFYVLEGYVSLITLFGLQQAFCKCDKKLITVSCINVVKVIENGRAFPSFSSSACGVSPSEFAEALEEMLNNITRYEEDVMQCGMPWSVAPCDNLRCLTVPGMYYLELIDESQASEIYVEQINVPVESAALFPTGIFFGN